MPPRIQRLAVPAVLALAALACGAPGSSPEHGALREADPGAPDRAAVERALDDFHRAAADADGARYFGRLAEGAIFLGTDATERWTKDEFRAYAEPYFARGVGWTYVPRERHVFLGPGGVAWFDELLDNAKYGACRGTGVLLEIDGEWRIAQYDLSIPIPNEVAPEVLPLLKPK